MNQFITVKDSEGVLRPIGFIVRNNDAGREAANIYEGKLKDGETLVVIEVRELGLF